MSKGTCNTPGCEAPERCKGLCVNCYGTSLRRKRNPLLPVRCPGCGSVFTPRSHLQKFCASRCARSGQIQRSSAKARKSRSLNRIWNCLQCGVDISAKRSDAKFCSIQCGHKYDNIQRCDRVRAANQAWAAANSDRVRDRAREYREKNRDAINARQAAWVRENREILNARMRIYVQERRSRKLGNPGFAPFTVAQWRRILLQYDHCCAYCGIRAHGLEVDHVIPISRGGRHAIGNVVPACRSCNARKNGRLLMEWRLTQLRQLKVGAI